MPELEFDELPGASRTSVVEICQRLRDAILNGELVPNSVATQVELADRLGVSRTPLREALRVLELEGFVAREPNRRVRIASLELDEVEELYVMRMSLESMALRLTIPQLTNSDHARLEGLLAQAERFALVDDWNGFDEPHRAFHAGLSSAAGPRIAEQLARWWDHAARIRQAYLDVVRLAGTYQTQRAEHRELLDAVEARDVDAAVRILARHQAWVPLAIAGRTDPTNSMSKVRKALQVLEGSATQ
jgi:DNA-binding GntR family transcriptional regulator